MSTLFVEEASQNISAGNKNKHLVIDTLRVVQCIISYNLLLQASQVVPEWLENYAKGSVSTAGYIPMGGKFGGKDIRKGMPKVRKNEKIKWD